ncbi:MAG: ABC transporter substrate-binding protein [Chitinispirillaceae bacterium]|nr:ABC transporter substrate-binding protein [Chitinispirillaceae bacterium]
MNCFSDRKPLPSIAPVVCMIAILAACSGKRHESDPGERNGDTLIDAAGRTVAVPLTVKRVVSPFTMYTRLIVAMGGCDRLVGISHQCVLPEEEQGCDGSVLDLPDVGPFGANVELIASLEPDLIFASQTDAASFAAKTRAAIVTVSFDGTIPMLEMFDRQIDIIGKAMRLQVQADSLKRFIRSVIGPVTSVTSTLPDSVKPRAYFAWTTWTGDILNTVCEFDPIELAGGINVAREAKHFAKGKQGILVSREHIIKWNPDVIFVSRFERQAWNANGATKALPMTVEEVMGDPLIQSVKAIRTKRVFYTTAFCNWWPQQRALAQVLYMAKLFHPALFSGLDVEEKGNEIFKRFYGADSLYTAMARELELYSWN